MRKFPLKPKEDFSSWEEFVDQAELGKTDVPEIHRVSKSRHNDSWRKASFEESVSLARNGWPEGLKSILAQVEHLETHIPTRQARTELVMSQVGPGTLDMGRYINGHPEPYVITQVNYEDVREDAPGTVIRVVFNISASSGVGAETMYRKGAVVAMLVNLLERSGKRVELIVGGASGYSTIAETTVCVKRPQDPLDMERLVFAVAHASCFRALMFSIWEQCNKSDRNSIGITDGSYGHPAELSDIIKDGLVADETVIYIGKSSLVDMGESDMLAWVKEQLHQQGIEIKGI